jgi:curved DNA-binding protein CbpA
MKQEYFRLVKLVHPDKNDHGQANLAFQKLQMVFQGL